MRMMRLVREDEMEGNQVSEINELTGGQESPATHPLQRERAKKSFPPPNRRMGLSRTRPTNLTRRSNLRPIRRPMGSICCPRSLAVRHPHAAHRRPAGRTAGVWRAPSRCAAPSGRWNTQYEDSGRSFRVEQVAGGYQMLTLPEYGEYLNQLHHREADTKLTKAALETLAIIAYKQPILRADVEAIRGVACGETIRSLMEKHLVRIAGRAKSRAGRSSMAPPSDSWRSSGSIASKTCRRRRKWSSRGIEMPRCEGRQEELRVL